MTVYELFLAFQDAVDKMSTESAPILSFQERDRALNYATEKFIKQRYGGNNVKNTSFEETQKRTDDLASLVEYDQILPSGSTPVFSNATNFFLPEGYWFAIREVANVTYLDCNQSVTKDVRVDARQHNQLNRILVDPFNRPEKDKVFRVMYQNFVSVYHDSNTTINIYKLAYIKEFQKLKIGTTYVTVDNLNNDDPLYYQRLQYWMPLHTHAEIANIAAQMFLERVQDPRYQSILNENNTQE
jgi:hypothetical protein